MPSMNNLIATNVAPERRATAVGAVFFGFHGATTALAPTGHIILLTGHRILLTGHRILL